MNENFTNISYVDEEDEAVNDIDGVETASLDPQVAQLTTKQPDSDLLAAIAQDLDVREKTVPLSVTAWQGFLIPF